MQRQFVRGCSEHGGTAAVAAQCVAVSTNMTPWTSLASQTERRLAMWDWVGGRYSVWSAVGLTLALAIGWKNFAAFLGGRRRWMSTSESRRCERIFPCCSALIGIWNRNFLERPDARRFAVRRPSRAIPCVPPAARDGEQRQVGAPRRRAGRMRDLPDHLGRARLERTALLLSVAAPRHGARLDRLPAAGLIGAWNARSSRISRPRTAWPKRGRLAEGDRSDRGGRRAQPHQRYPGNRGSSSAAVRASRRRERSASSSRSTSTRSTCRASSGTSTRSISGACSWARDWPRN